MHLFDFHKTVKVQDLVQHDQPNLAGGQWMSQEAVLIIFDEVLNIFDVY